MLRTPPLAALGLCAILGGCHFAHDLGGQKVAGSGKPKTESRDLTGFTEIRSYGAADCVVEVGGPFRVSVEADDNILPLIETDVSNGTLNVRTKGSFSTRNPVRVRIRVPQIASFDIKGSGDCSISGIRGERFAASISGSGDVRAEGRVKQLKASISGSGTLDLAKVHAESAKASIAGSGDILVHATQDLDASIRGSGDIAYFGSPKNVSRSVAGSGDIYPGN
jgi:hypothetical protein